MINSINNSEVKTIQVTHQGIDVTVKYDRIQAGSSPSQKGFLATRILSTVPESFIYDRNFDAVVRREIKKVA